LVLLTASVVSIACCGSESDTALIVVDISISGYAVPDELDALHFEFSDAQGVFVERTLLLSVGDTSPSLTLQRGARTPRDLTLVVYGDHRGTSVTSSDPVTLQFEDGEITHVTVSLAQ